MVAQYFLILISVSFVSYSNGQLASQEKQSILDMHNAARRQLGTPNMRKMGWSEELARIAEDVAKTCSNGPTPQSELITALNSQYSWIGESRHLVNSTDESVAVVSAFSCWHEGEGCTRDRREQVLYPDSFLLGCGAYYFPPAPVCRTLGTGIQVVCFYAPGALAGYTQLSGDPCTRCPEDAETCDDKLCVPSAGLDPVPTDEKEQQQLTTIPRVYWRSPWYSGFGGGTLITIAGIGFADDQFSTTDSPNVGNRVEFYNEEDDITLPCIVERYYTTSTRILCRTSASPDDVQRSYTLEVTVNGRKLSDILGSTYNGAYCGITYYEYYTPRISTISPHAKIPGEDPVNVTVIGKIRSYLVAETQEPNEEDEDRDLQTVDRLLLGGEQCDPCSGGGETTYGGYVDSNGNGGVSCRTDTVRIDSMNASLVLSEHGLAKVKLEDYSIDNKLRKYLFQTHPDITGVEPDTGSPAGGTLITIYGKHFTDPNGDIKAFISGIPCRVVNYTSTSVQCITGPAPPESAVYPGGRGVVREVWSDNFRWDPQTIKARPYGYPNTSYNNWAVQERFYRDNSYTPEFGEQYRFNQRYTGFFVPPIDSLYTFNFISDDLLDLYLSPNSLREDKELIAYTNYWTRNSWNYYPTQISSPKYLKAGQPYYLEVLQSQGPGGWNIGVAVKIHNLTWTDDFAIADHEQQVIEISSTVIRETQLVSITAHPKIQVITLELDDEEDIHYKLSYKSGTTQRLNESANATSVEDAINNLESISNIGEVRVLMERTAEEIELTIVFISSTNYLDDIVVTECSNYTSEVLQDFNNPLHEFSLSFDSKTTQLINATSSAEQVQEEVYGLFTTDCLVGDEGNVFFHDSYEGRTSPIFSGGTLDNYEEPFCGRFSNRNPFEVFENNNGYDAVTVSSFSYRYACFYVKGAIPNSRLRIHARPNPTDAYRGYAIKIEYEQMNDQWQQICIDMWQFLYDRFKQQHLTFMIRRIFFNNPSSTFWVDEFRITSSQPTVIQISSAVRPNGIYVDTVLVEKQQPSVPDLVCPSYGNVTDCRIGVTSFTIAYSVHQCAHQMPLISVSLPDDVVVTRLLAGSPPVGGNFSVSFEGMMVSDIPATAEASAVETILENTFGSKFEVSSTSEASCSGYKWSVRWSDRGGDLPLMEADGTHLTGNEVMITVVHSIDGGAWIRPLRGDMLRLPELNPQVEVSVNGIPASCRNRNCIFAFPDNETATIISVSPAEYGQDGSAITITGSGFPTNDAMVTVTIGDETCEIQSINETQITCIPAENQAGVYPIEILVDGVGYALPYENKDILFTYLLNFTDIEPEIGTIFGGNLVSFTGIGFPDFSTNVFTEYSKNLFGEFFHPSAYVLFDDYPCFIYSSNFTHLSCKPQAHLEDSVNITFMINNVELVLEDGYEYSSNFTSTILSVSPTTGPVFGGTEVTIDGENFHEDVTVEIGGVVCHITSLSDIKIMCNTTEHRPGESEVFVFSPEYGVSYFPSMVNSSLEDLQIPLEFFLREENKTNSDLRQSVSPLSTRLPTFSYELVVSSLSPCVGSLAGGTEVTITGKGFGEDTVVMETLGQRCDIFSLSYEEIKCTMPSTTDNYIIENSGSNSILGEYYAWEPSMIEISIGSTVTWKWTGSMLAIPQEFEVHQTSSLLSTDSIGFQSQSSIDGTFSYTFAKAGTYYYSSDSLNTICSSCTMSGTIIVKPLEELVTTLEVSVNGFPSLYNLDYSSLIEVAFGSGSGKENKCLSWVDAAANASLTDPPLFVYSECYTPLVYSIDSGHSTLFSKYKIHGDRFGDKLENIKVNFQSVSCEPSNVMYKSVTCALNQSSPPVPFDPLPLSIHVDNLGYALLLGEDVSDRSISLNPVITNIKPSQGSLLGGNILTIDGASFFEDNLQVLIGSSVCDLIEVEYGKITCKVPLLAENVQNISLPVRVAHDSSMNKSAVCYTGTNCSYTYTVEYTPVVFSVTPTEVLGEESTILTISGDLLEGDSIVLVGTKHECVNVTKLDDENVTCILQPIPAAEYSISVLVTEYGYAEVEVGIVSRLEVNSISPSRGSIRGGTVISVSGFGFSDVLTENRILIGNNECELIESSYSTINCSTPDFGTNGTVGVTISVTANGTDASVSKRQVEDFEADGFEFDFSLELTPTIVSIFPSTGQQGDLVTISGSSFTDTASDITVTIGATECSVNSSNETTVTCILGQSFVETFPVSATIADKGRADGDVTFHYILRVSGIDPVEGSFAGQNTLTVNGVGFSPTASFVTMCDKPCIPSGTPPSLTSLNCIVPSFTEVISNDTNISTKNCTVVVTSLSTTVSLEDVYTLRRELTPFVTSINDTRGGTAGGTIIKVNGTGFSGTPNVTIAGSECTLIEFDDDEIVCMTGAIGWTVIADVMVYINGKGYAIVSEDVYFYYVDLWSSIFTWGGIGLPQEGDFVIVGAGQTLVLDTITPILRILLIQGGEVIFDDVPSENGTQLHSELILITDGGRLQVGTEAKPYMNKAQIVMYGNVLSTELPLFGAKTLAVRNGTVDLHGKPISNTWTRLSTTAEPDTSTIYVQDDVSDWEVGGKIVIASTSYSQRENEELTISSIGNDSKTIYLMEQLAYRHIFYEQTIEGRYIQTSAEVGYLTRNIIFRGNRNEEWDVEYEACDEEFDPGQFAVQTCFNGRFGAETVGDQFGGQLMLHKGPRDKVVGRIEYTEFTHVGQAFRLGRYPIHFHLNGDVSDSYVRGNAIHHTFNRAVTIHAVDYLLVEKNVAFDIKGHAYFLEDGIEQGNIIQDNLGVFVKASSSLLNVDITPATFWVVNPNNTLRRNAAAGGSHFGFWYRLPENPTGPSFTTAVRPLELPLAEFSDNTAHSFGWYGIWIFPSYHPGGADTCEERTPAVFKNFLAWRNVRGVEFSEVGAVQLVNSTMMDNEIAGVEYTTVTAAWGKQGALIENTLIVAHSELRDYDDKRIRGGDIICTGSGIKTPHTYYLTVSNVTFVNFNETNCYALQACSHCRDRQGGFETRFEKLNFVNSPNTASWKWEHEQVFRDLDGTLTEVSGGALIPWTNALPRDNCHLHSGSSGSVPGAICDASVQFNRFGLTNPSPSSLTFRQLNATNIHGTVILDYVLKRLVLGPGYMAILPNRLEYTLEWSEGERFTNISYNSLYSGVTDTDYLFIRHDFPREVDSIEVNGKTMNASLDKPDPDISTTGDWFSNSNDTAVTYFVGGLRNCPANIPITFTTYRCFYEDCIPPPPPEPPTPLPDGRPNVTYMWSDPSIWPNGVVPTVNDTDITINSSLYVLVDEGDVLPRIRRLTIYGALEILDKVDRVIQAELILIDEFGQLIAGSHDEPYQHQLDFVLNGDLESPIYRLPNGGPVLGAKAIGVFGRLSLLAQEREQTWTFLTTTATAGSTEITVESPVDWKEGETIVISSTSFEANEAEEATISTVTNNGLTITLDTPLTNTHLGGVHNIDSCSVTVSAEVGLLSRNIRVLGTLPGSTDDTADSEAYSCRVLVSTYISNTGIQYTGSAQLSGVEFKSCGQEGFVESFDPRYSLAFLNTGTVTENSSYITDCSIHDGYNVGIGVYGTNGITIRNNVVHNTVGTSIDIRGSGHAVVNNLAVVAQFPGTYRGRDEPFNFEWTANYELTAAIDLMLYGNSAAGGARAGYHTNGENCLVEGFTPQWRNNIAHSTLHGIHIPYPDGHVSSSTRGCSSLHNFHIYSAYHYGIFSFSRAGIQISDCTLVNNYAAVFTAVIGPAALSHGISEKTVTISDTRIISSIHSGDSVTNCTAYSHKPVIAYHPRSHSGIQSPTSGHVGVILTSFTSGNGHFPKFPWTDVPNYPAISGLTTLRNVSFCKFGMHCDSRREVAVLTHPSSEDCQHPVELQNTELIDVDEESKFFNHVPILGSVNPSDCVDMDCDGLKKILIRDLDGSFIGSQPGLNTLISNSALEWDGDSRRGLGDYRIPRTMLAEPNGGKIDPNQLYPNKGIYRGNNNQCTFNSNWNTYHCAGIDHLMMVVESLDADTEVRRLSPIGIGANGYIDLVNGPQDHGWCGGYTCQERISTFYTIVASGLEYSIGLASTNPQDMRLIILNAEPTQKLLIGLFYNSPQRLDIFVDSEYIAPTNGYFGDDGNLRYTRGSTSDFLPTLSNSHGTNYYDRTYKKLYFVMEGGKPITIMTQPVIQLGIDLPPITVDEFFETNLIQNLALLLNIPPNRIRIVNVISESSNIKKRQTSSTRVEIEIGSPPTNETQQTNQTQTTGGDGTYYNTTRTVTTDEEFQQLSDAATRTAEIIQTGALSDSIGVEIVSASLVPPEPEVIDPTGGVRVAEDEGGPQPGDPGTESLETFTEQQIREAEAIQNDTETISLSIPTALSSITIPSEGIEGLTLTQPIVIAMHDGNGDVVVNLGVNVAWRLQASIIDAPDGVFLTNNTVDIKNGKATFSDLTFSHSGTYRLQFTVSYPADAEFTLEASTSIEISARQLYIQVETQPPSAANTTFNLYPYARISIRDSSTEELVLNLGWRGREWSAMAVVIDSSTGRQYGSSHRTEIVDGYAVFADISIDVEGVHVLRFSVETDPSSTEVELPESIDSVEIEVKQLPFTRFVIVYNEDFEEVIGSEVERFKEEFVSYLTQQHDSITIYNVSVVSGSIVISFFATTSSADTLAEFSSAITMSDLLESFVYNGMTLNLTSAIQDPSYPIIFPTESPKEKTTYLIVVIISIAVGMFILLAMCVLTIGLFSYYGTKKMSKQKHLKVKPVENDYEKFHMTTIYRNSPIFDEDGDYPLFHIVRDDDNQLSLAKDASQPTSRSSTMDDLDKMEKKHHQKAMHMSNKEIKVGGQVNTFDNPQMTQGDFEDKMSLDELLKLPGIGSNNNNNNNNNNGMSPPPMYIEHHPNSVADSEVSLPPSYRTPPILPLDPVYTIPSMPLDVTRVKLPPIHTNPKADSEMKPTDESLHGLKVTTFN